MNKSVTSGDIYIPYNKRSGNSSIVYFTRDLSPQGLIKIYQKVSEVIFGKIAVKLHTGEKHGPNIIPHKWVEELFKSEIPDATIIETNTYYEGDRYTTAQHRETLEVNGWTFSPVDILDEDGAVMIPVKDGTRLKEISVGKNLLNYDSMLTLTHFKGHTMGGFGGSNKNIGIGCADGPIGKKMIHKIEESGEMWSAVKELLMERMTDSTKGVTDHFKGKIAYINVMRNMSVSCDCEGLAAEPVVTPDVGICASLDILSVDQACVDIIYAMNEKDRHAMVERIETRHGHRQLSYMKELGMGNDLYTLIDIDSGKEITPSDITEDIKSIN